MSIPNNVNRLFKVVGLDYPNKVILRVLEGTIKDIIGKWNVQDLSANREKSIEESIIKLQKQLFDMYRHDRFSDNWHIFFYFEKDIKEKVTSEQEAVKAMNNHDPGKGKQKEIVAEVETKLMAIRPLLFLIHILYSIFWLVLKKKS